jgi:hypothetical protein
LKREKLGLLELGNNRRGENVFNAGYYTGIDVELAELLSYCSERRERELSFPNVLGFVPAKLPTRVGGIHVGIEH